MVSSPSRKPKPSQEPNLELAEVGWRVVVAPEADGTETTTWIPLTSEEFLHPTEACHLPNSTFHDDMAGHIKDVLTRRYANDPTVGVFRDLIVEWDTEQKDNCPDTFVAFGISNKDKNRTRFIVDKEGVRPAFVVEVVSPHCRKEDREIKVVQYALAGVREYVIVDRRRQRGQILEEVLGYRLVAGHYQPITPDEEGRIFCETVGVLMSLQEGSLVIEDGSTGERLLSSVELEEANAEMAKLLARYQEQFGELPDDNTD